MFLDIKKKDNFMKKFLIIFILFSFNSFSLASDLNKTIYAHVNGLVCDFCARALEKTIGKQESVKSINVDLTNKIITINLNEGKKLDDTKITQLIEDSGYSVREIIRE